MADNRPIAATAASIRTVQRPLPSNVNTRQPICAPLSVDYRSTIGRLSVDNQPTIGRLPADSRPIDRPTVDRYIGRQSTDKGAHIGCRVFTFEGKGLCTVLIDAAVDSVYLKID